MTYEYEIKKKAMKFIQKQERRQQERIFKAIYALPLSGDVKKMQGEDNLYRLRVGDYRLLFEMNLKTHEITLICVTDADNRGQIYKSR
jgi:mRNA interferase RelE/StbE